MILSFAASRRLGEGVWGWGCTSLSQKTLMPDFEANETAYRNGVATENGILIRKASWKCTAKPIVEAA